MGKIAHRAVITLTFTILALAVATLLPWPSASTPSMMGYRALCPASPVSTVMLLVVAAGLYVWASSGTSDRDSMSD